MNKLLPVAVLFSIGIALAGFQTFGNSVTLHLAFHLGDNSSGDIVLSGDDYILAEEGGTVLALLSSGTVFGTRNSSYSAVDNLFEMRQGLENNRFLLTYTNGTNETIKNRLNLLGDKKIIPKTCGSLSTSIPSSFPLYMRLDYDDIDITTSTHFTTGVRELIIRNEGKNSQGLYKIAIEVKE